MRNSFRFYVLLKEKIMQSSWFRKGLDEEKGSLDAETDADAEEADATADKEKKWCINLNAFEIITLSTGFDLSALFKKGEEKEEMRFTTNREASEIKEKQVEIRKELKMRVRKKEQEWRVMMEARKVAQVVVVKRRCLRLRRAFTWWW